MDAALSGDGMTQEVIVEDWIRKIVGKLHYVLTTMFNPVCYPSPCNCLRG